MSPAATGGAAAGPERAVAAYRDAMDDLSEGDATGGRATSDPPTPDGDRGDAAAGLVDWGLAAATARRLSRVGPEVTLAEAAAAVSEMTRLAGEAVEHVARVTGLPAVPGPAARVVDRDSWVRGNIAGLEALLTPLFARLAERRPPGRLAATVGARVTAVQAGAVLAFLSGKVLGQYEIFAPGGGVLLLVAPNIVAAERALEVDPRDFRLWVSLHEETHRSQFTAVPWLRDHLVSEIGELVAATELDPEVLRDRLAAALRELGRLLAGGGAGGEGLLRFIQNPRQRAVLDRLTGFMSLVEGHAEYVMDAVGTDVVPSVATIRERFQQRRGGAGPADRLLRRLLGLDVKMRQYSEGAAFVRAVVADVGIDGFNAVWQGPAHLPTRDELAAPRRWVERVHGASAARPA